MFHLIDHSFWDLFKEILDYIDGRDVSCCILYCAKLNIIIIINYYIVICLNKRDGSAGMKSHGARLCIYRNAIKITHRKLRFLGTVKTLL